MTASLARPAHWDDPDPVPGFTLRQRRRDLGVGEVWEAEAFDGGAGLIRLLELPDDPLFRAKANRLADALPLLGHPDLDPVRQVVAAADGLALVRPAAGDDVTTLASLLARRRSISMAEAAGLADRMGRALGYLHDNGVTHGRLAAGDVLLRPNGHPSLTGYGVAGIQGAGGLPADDIAALAALLLSALPADAAASGAGLPTLFRSVAEVGSDGHVFADEVIRRRAPAPMRLRPSPGRRLPAASTSRLRLITEPGQRPAPGRQATAASSFGPADMPVSSRPVETLDAAVRALRAGARESATRQPRGPRRPTAVRQLGRRPADRPARHLAHRATGRGAPLPSWLWRVAPAAAVLLVTVLLGWRFVGPAANADSSPAKAAAIVAAPDRTTVARLDAARSAAFAAGAAARLTAADAPGSPALAADVAAMSVMLSHGGRARGLAPQLYSATLLSRTGDRAALRVVDELPPYDFVSPAGQIIARSPGHGRQVHEVRLRLVSGQWRYQAVLAMQP